MNLLTLKDWKKEDVECVFELTKDLKGRRVSVLDGKVIALLFEAPSTRTRVSFERAVFDLGGQSIFLYKSHTQMVRGEPYKDVARVLERYVDGIVARVYEQDHLEEIAHYFSGPVINGLTKMYHPCQALADIFTLKEIFGDYSFSLAFFGDGNANTCRSLGILSQMLGFNFYVVSPPQFKGEYGKWVENWENLEVDAIYTDVFVSMGFEREKERRLKLLAPYQINKNVWEELGKPYVMHCLPAHRGEEITEDVLEGEKSLVWKQAENRLHVQKGILAYCFEVMG